MRVAAGLILVFSGAVAVAEAPDAALSEVVVGATRMERAAFEVPAIIVVREIRRDTLGVNLAESLAGVAGLAARDRQNYAQDTQISIRGFGARSSFGIRGVRLYVDGIPATQPDGQGQVSHFNLATADRVEVLRGPFSALYGNSSGGVISMHIADGSGAPGISGGAAYTDFATQRADIGSAGALDAGLTNLNYRVGYTHFRTDGARGHSAAQRESLQGKLKLQGAHATLSLLGNYFDAPDAQDPLGLTAAQYAADSLQTAATSVQFNTRKSARQTQYGAVLDYATNSAGQWRWLAYGGERRIQQFLAVPVATQADPRHSGGVVALQTQFSGTELRWSREFNAQRRPLTLVAGATYDALTQQRRGYENFSGATLGVVGALRRDESNHVASSDQYLQAEWRVAPQWLLLAGVRRSELRFDSVDHYIRSGNPDDSGRVRYAATTPVASLLWRASDTLHLYAAYGQGFETPTLVELAYRSDGAPGLNFALKAARTSSTEVGTKLKVGTRWQAEVALFQAASSNELVVVRNSSGRAAYANAARTRRQGAELSLVATLAPRWHWQLAYTALRATVVDAYRTCSVVPCMLPTTLVAAGSRLPGAPASSVYQQLSWGGDAGWHASIEARYTSEVYANDLNSARASSYSTVDAGVRYAARGSSGRLATYLRIENLFAMRYIGSVIVNEANGRYFEPAAGRTVLAGLNFSISGS